MDSPRGSMQSSSGGGGDVGGEEEHTSFPSAAPAAANLPSQFTAAGGFFANYASEFDPFAYAPLLGPHVTQATADPDTSPAPPARQTSGAARPKKRPRASRRAPTTVLTTDTSNFRQMVQEFTGIPPQPFSALQQPRTDGRFGTGAMRHAAALEPKVLLRPFPHKVPITSFGHFASGSPPAGIKVTSELPPSSTPLGNPSLPFPSLTQSLSLLDPGRPTTPMALVGGSGIPTGSGPSGLLFTATTAESGGGGVDQ